MHLKRWITGLTALPILIVLIFKGGTLSFTLLVAIVCVLALWEYFRIVFNHRTDVFKDPILMLAFIFGPVIIWSAHKNSFDAILALVSLNLMISGFISLTRFKSDALVFETVFKQVLGLIYIPFFLSYLILIRNGINGAAWIFSLLFIVFAGDTCALYAGSFLGRRKLCPSVSPGKTIEGAVGGLAANLGMGAILKGFFLPASPWGCSIIFFLSVGIAGQVGDLFESEIKRSSNVKDSGGILPGHGGMLDRIDAILFTAPVAYFFKTYLLS